MIIVYGKKNYILNLGRFDYLYRYIFNNFCGGFNNRCKYFVIYISICNVGYDLNCLCKY